MAKRKRATEYAIVDIETTGGNARGSRMTEIAIIIHDGTNELERWESLINPEKDIPYAIFALTGINNEMVKDAPVFGDLAPAVYALLKDRVFVAHNVNFDYSFIKHQLEEEGYDWSAPKLCTVRMARKIRPGLPSYSLGRLCDSLDVPITDRHRAGGDATATAILFHKLLDWDTDKIIEGMIKKSAPDQRLPPNLAPEYVQQLPQCPGVYYFHNAVGKAIYVGKAVNLKKRVIQHFTGHNINPQRQHFLREIHSISFEPCATELMALLLECIEIKRLWPVYNRALKRFEPKYGMFRYTAMNGYEYLAIGKLAKGQPSIAVFNREYDGVKMLRTLAETYQLDFRFCKFGKASYVNHMVDMPEEKELPDMQEHNEKVDLAIAGWHEQQPSFAIMDKGRAAGEQSCIWVERGHFYAMGYIDEQVQFTTFEDLRAMLKRYYGNHYMMQLIHLHAAKHPAKVKSLIPQHKAAETYVLPERAGLLF